MMKYRYEFSSKDIAHAWVNVHKNIYNDIPNNDRDSNLAEKIFLLMEDDPHFSWEAIKNIVNIIENDSDIINNVGLYENIIGMLGAGDVENLVESHGFKLIDSIEDFARKHAAFADSLSYMWKGETSDSVWEMINKLKGVNNK